MKKLFEANISTSGSNKNLVIYLPRDLVEFLSLDARKIIVLADSDKNTVILLLKTEKEIAQIEKDLTQAQLNVLEKELEKGG